MVFSKALSLVHANEVTESNALHVFLMRKALLKKKQRTKDRKYY